MHEKQYAMGSCLQTFVVSAVACKVSLSHSSLKVTQILDPSWIVFGSLKPELGLDGKFKENFIDTKHGDLSSYILF